MGDHSDRAAAGSGSGAGFTSGRTLLRGLNGVAIAGGVVAMVLAGAGDLPRVGLAAINGLPFAAALAVDSHLASVRHRRLARVVNGLWVVMGAALAWITGVEPGGQPTVALAAVATLVICGLNTWTLRKPVPTPPPAVAVPPGGVVARAGAGSGVRHEPASGAAVLGVGLLALTPIAWLLLGGLIVFCLALGTPFFGALTAFKLSAWLGCTLPNWGGPCEIHGFWVDRLVVYNLPFFNILGTPLLFLYAFWDLVLGWLLLGLTVLAVAHTVRGEGG